MAETDPVRLSVIVPTLTGAVPQTLLAQVEGRADVELVVVKGVSPVGRARNEGLARAKGDYIAWVDADDEVTDDWREEIFLALAEDPDVVVIGHTWMTTADFGFEKIWRGGDLLGAVLRQDVISGELVNKIIRRALWEGVRFDDAARTMEDGEVLPRVLARARQVIPVRRSLYRYYAREGSLTHQTSVSMQREIFGRILARIDEVKRLGLWGKYETETMVGVAHVVYTCAEKLNFFGHGDDPAAREMERWLRRRLPGLLLKPTRLTYKVKWILAAFGGWRVVRWYYVRVLGDRGRAGVCNA